MADVPKKTKMTKTKWGFLIAIIVVVDIVQIILDFFAVGLAADSLIDIVVGASLLLIFKIQKVHLTPKQLMSICSVFAVEIIPVANALPFWSADIIWIYGEEKLKGVLDKAGPIGTLAKVGVDLEEGDIEDAGADALGTAESAVENIPPTIHDFPLSSGVAMPPRNVVDLRDARFKDEAANVITDVFNADTEDSKDEPDLAEAA